MGRKIRSPALQDRRRDPITIIYDDDDEYDGFRRREDDSDDGYHLDVTARAAGRDQAGRTARKPRQARGSAAPQANVNAKRSKQPALNLASGEYQLPALGLLAEPAPVADNHGLSDEALEENARMLEAVLTDFGVKGRITAVRPGPVVTLV